MVSNFSTLPESTFTLTALAAGIPFMLIGFIFYKYPPKKINPFVGYRSRRSMQNQQTWDEANRYSNKLMIKLGSVLVILGIIFYFIPLSAIAGTIAGIVPVLSAVLLLLVKTENRLQKLFDDEGNRREQA